MFVEKITPYYRKLLEWERPDGPLARMVRFSEGERRIRPEEAADPIGDRRWQRGAHGRLIHRYRDRALLLLTDRCAAHCRFCLRRDRLCHPSADITAEELDEVCAYIAAHSEIQEVILSGGDPLSLADASLLEIIGALRRAGARSIRLHTRFPVYDPRRCGTLGPVASRLDVIVIHVNHHREITPEFLLAVEALRPARLLLNQSVLLKGVNDSFRELLTLSKALGAAGILPYYLHYPDLAPGISHFRIPVARAVRLVQSLQGHLPGYLLPRLILDIPGGKGKVTLAGGTLHRLNGGGYRFRAPLTGEAVTYREVL
ncbi:MAG TPA: KamA family radical SAM protein [Syntrophales bacterium]|jgi:lysine 2,3-aminomutase|nr:KamA family radical SAM protein [Syntrophales bacterium]HRU87546.1 KamA family radical SAM protein [Syntrophales bacterium]